MAVGLFVKTALLVLAFAAVPAAAQEAPPTAQKPPPVRTDLFPGLFERLKSNGDAQALWGACPANIYRTQVAFWTPYLENPDVEVEQCGADPLGCYRECFEARNENACFALARAFQDNADEKFSRHWETLFAKACATGSAGGCTNRGAGIRNGEYADDPFTAKPSEIRNSCLFRSFRMTCQADDAWGCTMLGQSYEYGEGVAQSRLEAEQAYRKACQIDPDFDACSYAQEQIEALK